MPFTKIIHYIHFKGKRRTFVVVAILCIAIYLVVCVSNFEVFESNIVLNGDVFVNITENITLVTAYFDIGSFQKGLKSQGLNFTKQNYFRWAKAYKYIVNPLVVFTDSMEFIELMKNLRCKMTKKTKIIKIRRRALWPFRLVNKIGTVFSQPNYPTFEPNTVLPEYSAVQHAKYAAVAHAIKQRYLMNEFYAWIDIGYFREVAESKRYSQLLPPSNIDRNKIAFNQISVFDNSLTPSSIFKNNIVWVGGGMFVGVPSILLEFEKLYRRAVNYYLEKNLMNSDQQVIYSLYCEEGRKRLKPDIELQIFEPKLYYGDPWFYLGYHCRRLLPKVLLKSNGQNECV